MQRLRLFPLLFLLLLGVALPNTRIWQTQVNRVAGQFVSMSHVAKLWREPVAITCDSGRKCFAADEIVEEVPARRVGSVRAADVEKEIPLPPRTQIRLSYILFGPFSMLFHLFVQKPRVFLALIGVALIFKPTWALYAIYTVGFVVIIGTALFILVILVLRGREEFMRLLSPRRRARWTLRARSPL